MNIQDLPLWLDALLAVLVIAGTAFALVGSWGLAKLSDFARRLHGPTKATTLGVGCVLIASALYFSVARGAPSLHELLITLFLLLTAPVSAHLLIQAAWRADDTLTPPPPPKSDQGSYRWRANDAGWPPSRTPRRPDPADRSHRA